MKSTPLVCSALVASLGFATVAQAQPDWHDVVRQGVAQESRQQWSGQRSAQAQRWQQRQQAAQHWQAPAYQQRYQAHQYDRRWHGYDHDYDARAYAPRTYAYGGYYGAPQYRSYYAPGYYSPGYYVGGYAPDFVARRYWINDWRARHLYAPPYGYEWVQTDAGDVLLVALATGLIANAILAAH